MSDAADLWACVLLRDVVLPMCCVVAVLTFVIVCRLSFVCVLSGVSRRDEQGGVAWIQDTGKFSAEHCTFSGNTATVSPAARALLRVTLRFL